MIHTTQLARNVEVFKGVGTCHYQFHHPPDIFLVMPRQVEFPEMQTVR